MHLFQMHSVGGSTGSHCAALVSDPLSTLS